jgi:uncharacterized repeat protein (TIGR01451 family)
VGGTVNCRFVDLTNGARASIALVVKTSAEGIITNNVTITSALPDPNLTNNTSRVNTTVTPQIDITVATVGDPDPVTVNNPLAYVVNVYNLGPSAATNVVMSNTLPAQVSFVSASATQGSCTATQRTVTCALGNLPKNSRATVTISVSPPTVEGSLTNVASAFAASPTDPALANNTGRFVSRVSLLTAVSIKRAGTNVIVSWPTSTGASTLQSLETFSPGAVWTAVTNVPAVIAGQNVVTQRVSNTSRFYRTLQE